MKRYAAILLFASAALAGCGGSEKIVYITPTTEAGAGPLILAAAWSAMPGSDRAEACEAIDSLGVEWAASEILDSLGPQAGDYAVTRTEVEDFLTEACS